MNNQCKHYQVKYKDDNAAYGTISQSAGRDKIEYCDMDGTRTNAYCGNCSDFEPQE